MNCTLIDINTWYELNTHVSTDTTHKLSEIIKSLLLRDIKKPDIYWKEKNGIKTDKKDVNMKSNQCKTC